MTDFELLVGGATNDGEDWIETLEHDRVEQHLAQARLDRQVQQVVAQLGHVFPRVQRLDGLQHLKTKEKKLQLIINLPTLISEKHKFDFYFCKTIIICKIMFSFPQKSSE